MILIDVYIREQEMTLMFFMLHLKVKILLELLILNAFVSFKSIEWREEEIAKINATKQGAGKFN